MGFHVSLGECIARRYMLGLAAGLKWIEASRLRHHRSTLRLIIHMSQSKFLGPSISLNNPYSSPLYIPLIIPIVVPYIFL